MWYYQKLVMSQLNKRITVPQYNSPTAKVFLHNKSAVVLCGLSVRIFLLTFMYVQFTQLLIEYLPCLCFCVFR